MGDGIAVLPLAITRADATHACVGALTETGEWVRPEPVTVAEVESATTPWAYGRWSVARLGPPTVADPRPEDRTLLAAPVPGSEPPPLDRRKWMDRFVDPGVHAALSGSRSLGLVRADVHAVRLSRSTGGRVFVRFTFTDDTGEEFDWIVPDIATADAVLALPPESTPHWLSALRGNGPPLLAVGLTRPNGRFPGRFRGCHPLVVGVHRAPEALKITS